jgi:hypothetical protein
LMGLLRSDGDIGSRMRRSERSRGRTWRAMSDDDEHYVYAIAL